MLQRRKRIITITVLVSLSVLFISYYFFIKKDPVEIIETKLNIKLPTSSKIVNFEYGFIKERFRAKVKINEEDIESLRKSLFDYFKFDDLTEDNFHIPNYNNSTSWWDMDKENVVNAYSRLVSGKKVLFFSAPKTEEIGAFIVKQDDGLYYLYIAYR